MSEAPVTDAELVKRVLEGDERAFRTLYVRYEPMVSRRLRRVLGRLSQVEDVLQVTFVEVYRSLPRYDPERPFSPWVSRIAVRSAIQFLRQKQRRRWLQFGAREDVQDYDASSAEDRVESRQLLQHVFRAMERLPPKKRVAFALHYLEGLGFTEIGAIVDASPQTVRARVLSAREHVTRHLERVTDQKWLAIEPRQRSA